jgi:flavin-dependent dehydrogenase
MGLNDHTLSGPPRHTRSRQVRPEAHAAGHVWHTVGYPLDAAVYGGSFLYHMSENRVALG